MLGHLSDQALLDLVEGRGDAAAERHASGCASCRGRVQAAREALAASRASDVPEPSPLFWESFRRDVGQRIEYERAPGRSALLPAFAALAASVALAFAVISWPPQPPRATGEPALPAWSPLPAPGDDDVGAVVIGALNPTEDDLVVAAPCVGLGCLDGLSEAETQAVTEALRAELGRRRL